MKLYHSTCNVEVVVDDEFVEDDEYVEDDDDENVAWQDDMVVVVDDGSGRNVLSLFVEDVVVDVDDDGIRGAMPLPYCTIK